MIARDAGPDTAQHGLHIFISRAGIDDGVDLLHAYPVADAPFFDPYADVGCQSAVDVVPLQMNFNGNKGVDDAGPEVRRSEDALPTTHHPLPTTER